MDKKSVLGIILIVIAAVYFFGNQYFEHQKKLEILNANIQSIEITKKYPIRTYINDFANIIPAASIYKMNSVIYEIKNRTNSDIVLVTIPSLTDISQNLCLNTLKENIGLNNKNKKEGILILYIADTGNLAVTGGYRYSDAYLQKIKADELSKQINNNYLAYQDYQKGFEKLVAKFGMIISERNDLPVSQNNLALLYGNKYIATNNTAPIGMTSSNIATNQSIMSLFSRNNNNNSSLANPIPNLQDGSVNIANAANPFNFIPFIFGLFGMIILNLGRVNAYLNSPNYGNPNAGMGFGLDNGFKF